MRKVAQTASKCGAMSIEHNVNAAAAAAAAAQHDVDGFVIKHPKSNALAHPYTCIHTHRDRQTCSTAAVLFLERPQAGGL